MLQEVDFEEFTAAGESDGLSKRWAPKAAQLFGEIDKDQDGQLSQEEWRSWVAANPDRASSFVAQLDTSTGETIEATALQSWALMDTDQNGWLSGQQFERGYVGAMKRSFVSGASDGGNDDDGHQEELSAPP